LLIVPILKVLKTVLFLCLVLLPNRKCYFLYFSYLNMSMNFSLRCGE
jgi:hypothetical protein